MIAVDTTLIVVAFLTFCRVGTCLMIMPGLSSPRVPMQVRLALAAGLSLALTPLSEPALRPLVEPQVWTRMLGLVLSEMATGGLIGACARAFFGALQFMMQGAATMAGYTGIPGVAPEEAEGSVPLSSLITLTATTLFFVTGMHGEVALALAQSYRVLVPATSFDPQGALGEYVSVLSQAFALALRVAAPFVVFAVIANLAIGLANKLTPQIPVFFISMPFMLAGALAVLYATGGHALAIFTDGFSQWLAQG
ncbi:MAG: flagellar biosynthetic protein FliR [Hyphomicrobiales bacterium]